MRIAYLDCFSGISVDMVLGALLDLGVSDEVVFAELRKIPLTDYSVEVKKETHGPISGTRVMIEAGERVHRSFRDIQELISRSTLTRDIKAQILAVYEKLARAEAHVQHQSALEVQCHEAGAVEAVLAVAGAVIGFQLLEIDRILSSSVPLGRGLVTTDQGVLPLPAPVTIQLLEGVPIYGIKTDREVVTPTGAALLAGLVHAFGPIPEMTLEATGYGVGRDPAANPPDLIRLLVGVEGTPWNVRRLVLLETNIDDMNPEIFGYVLDKLLQLGALDVCMVPIQMKKNRPGVILQVLIEPALQTQIIDVIFQETTTLGIRIQEVRRVELSREIQVIKTPYGPCQVKRVLLPDGGSRIIPEFEECKRLAARLGRPLREVYETVVLVAKQQN